MRISERMRYNVVQNRVNQSKDRNAQALERLSSLKDITKLSDDPTGAKQILRFREKINDKVGFQRNIEFASGFLERSENAIQGLTDNLIRAKELAIAMSNDTYDAQSRDASGREIKEIIEEIIQLGNTSFNGRYVFAGFRNQTPPLNQSGDYLGDDGKIFLQIDKGNFRQINVNSRNLFEADSREREQGHFNMMASFDILLDGMKNNDKNSIHKAMNEISHQIEKTTSYQATIGGISRALNDTARRLETEVDFDKAELSKVQDADMFDATSEFKRTETTLQSTLMASNKLLQPSLLNFMQ
jgi:flagellar hook-associated protein 3 FlgL